MPLKPVDTDARWRTINRSRFRGLSYQENIIVDRGGFILGRKVTYSSEGEWKAVDQMLGQLPVKPATFAADTSYSAGRLRSHLEELGITAYIPVHPNHEANMVAKGGFVYRGDHLLCPQGKPLRISAFLKRDMAYQYVARQHDCQRCPLKAECLPPNQKRRYVALSMYHPVFLRARERNRTSAYVREMKSRQTIAEGTFASLDRLGWARCRLRGLSKVDCEGFMAAIAHNVLKAVRRLGDDPGTSGPDRTGSHLAPQHA